MSLGPGSIAFTGFNADASDNLAFVVLEPIAAGTQIHFTNDGWTGGGFFSDQGKFTWTASADIAAGTVVRLDNLATAAPSSNLGAIAFTEGTLMDILASNETIYAYVGTPTAPTAFLAAIANDSFSAGGGTLDGTGLVIGQTAIELKPLDGDADVAAYNGRHVSATSFGEFPHLINDYHNWITQDAGGNQNADGIPPDAPFSTTAFVVDPNANAVNFAASSLSVSQNEGDSGTTLISFTVERSGSTAGAVNFSGTLAAAGTTNAADFGGVLPTTFNGIIPDGASSAVVSIAVSGDTLFEQNESFTLKLTAASNASTPAFVADTNITAVGTIANDDPQPVDIAFVGFNADGGDNLAFATLKNISAGTQIHFTDNNWNGSVFASSEADWTWTASADIAAGSIVTMDGIAQGGTATSNLGTILFNSANSRDIEGQSSEVVYAYLGPTGAPTAFLTAIAGGGFTDFSGASFLANTGLTPGANAIDLGGDADIGAYTGPRNGLANLADFRTLINDSANWVSQDHNFDQSQDGLAPDVPFSRAAFTTDASPQRIAFSADSLNVSHAEGNSGTTSYSFTVERAGGTTGAVDFSGVITPGAGADAADFGGVLPASFSGTIANGASSAVVTVHVSGDIQFEQNESFSLELQHVSNGSAVAVLGDDALATATIVNDDIPQLVQFAPGSLHLNQVEGNAGTVAMTFIVERNGPGAPSGDIDFSGSFTAGGTSAADFAGGVLPSGFSGTIHDGATSANVTIMIAGDSVLEADESFTLLLQSVSSTTTPVTIGAASTATGTILDDEPVPSIAFTGFDVDGNDNLAFVALSAISSGTVIQFSDKNWNGTAFTGTEGTITWTANANVAAGSVVSMSNLAAGALSASTGTLVRTGTFNLSTTNENLYAYVGTTTTPLQFLAAVGSNGFNATNTLAGTGLTEGLDALSFAVTAPQVDTAAFVGARYGHGSFTDYLASINNPANWITEDTSATNDDNNGKPPDLPFSTVAFTTNPNAQAISFATGSLLVSALEGNSGTTNLAFTVERTGGTTGALDFTGTLQVSGTVNGGDFGGSVPAFSGTIADGATSTTISIPVSGDTAYEANESFTLTLNTATNASVPAFVAPSNAVATGAILNDDPNTANIAFVGISTDGEDDLAFAALSSIAAGTVIQFTDNTWNGVAFTTIENNWSWTATSDIAAGSIITMNGLGDAQTPVSNLGTIAFSSAQFRDIGNEETIYAYTGAPGAPAAFLTALSTFGYDPFTGTLVNTGLVAGDTAVMAPEFADIAAYHGPRSGLPSLSDYAFAINNGNNWIGQALGQDASHDGIDPDLPFSLSPLTTNPAAQLIQFAENSLLVKAAEGDSGTTNLTFTVERSGSTSGVLNFTGTFAAGADDRFGDFNVAGTLADDDFVGGVPATFNGSFADGASTATVTISVTADKFYEVNENFTLELQSASNASASAVIGGHSQAVGTIVNDDVRSPDIAVVGWNTDGNDAVAFAALSDIAAGTVIKFTDRTWSTDHFDSDGSVWTWTATSDIALGEIVTLDMLNGTAPSSNLGTINRTGSGELSTIGGEEVLYAYLGEADDPTAFITAFNPGYSFLDLLSTGLTELGDAFAAAGPGPTLAYKGPLAGFANASAIHNAIYSTFNWQYQFDDVVHASADGNPPDLPFSTLPFSTNPNAQLVGFAGPQQVVHAEPDNGGSVTYTFTVQRTGGMTGDVAFTGHVLMGSYADGAHITPEDFGGIAPTFSGTIAAGETSATIEIAVSGDNILEADEFFTLQLDTISNSLGQPVAAGTFRTQGVILDFDPAPTSIADGDIITGTIPVTDHDHFVIAAGGQLLVDGSVGPAFFWFGSGTDVVIDNAGLVRDTQLLDTEFNVGQSLTINNLAGAVFEGDFHPDNDMGPGSSIVLNNAGTIQARGRILEFRDTSTATSHVTINNLAGGIIQQLDDNGTDMSRPGIGGVVNNWGIMTMAPGPGGGDGLDFQSDHGGAVNNFTGGVIEGARHAITGDNAVTVYNGVGALIAGRNGSAVNIDNDSTAGNTVDVTNYGTLEGRSGNLDDSDGDAIDTDGLAAVENYGAILGLGHNGYHSGEPNVSEAIATGGGTVNNYAGGTIHGYGRGIQIDDSSNGPAFAATIIHNEGTIQGDGNAPTGVLPEDAIAFTPIGNEAINIIGNFGDTITSSGSIVGGVKTGGGGDSLTNSGTMSATGGSALDMGDGNDTLDQTGTIQGDVLMGAGDDVVSLSTGSSIASMLDGGDDNDTLNLTGTGEGVVGNSTGFETLNLIGGAWALNEENLAVHFQDGTQTLRIDEALLGDGNFAGTIFGFAGEDSIDLKGIGAGTTATLGIGNVLTVAGGGLSVPITLQLDPAQDFSGKAFVAASDSAGGTNLTLVNATVLSPGDSRFNGGSGDDVAFGGTGDDQMSGKLGNDHLSGDDGDDRVDGNQGNDTLLGGAGDDRLHGGDGNDVVDGGDGGDRLTGDTGDDQLFGGAGGDQLLGGSGNDSLQGGDGGDDLDGGTGNDQLSGGNGGDELLGGMGDDVLLAGDGNDDVNGGAGNDSLNGGNDDDAIKGLAGDDTIDSGAGNDAVTGGIGADSFVFAPGSGDDVIADFKPTLGDRIDLTAYHFNDTSEVLALVHASGVKDSLIVFDSGDSILIAGLKPIHLDAGDFIL